MTIDIMMPFYGDPGLFRTAVLSVLAQDDPDWRLVVIDDRYPHWSPEEWLGAVDDERVEYVLNDSNLGVSGNFQRSVDLARADHFTIMGCDDVMLSGYVRGMRLAFERFPTAAYAQPGVIVIDGSGRTSNPLADRVKRHYAPHVRSPTLLQGEDLARGIVRGNWTYFPSICWSRHVVTRWGFRPEYGVALDLDLQLRIIDDGGAIVVDPDITFAYRRHSGSVSAWTANDGTRFLEERSVLLEAAERAQARGWLCTARAARIRLSSRLSALTRLPAAVRSLDRPGISSLLRHAFR